MEKSDNINRLLLIDYQNNWLFVFWLLTKLIIVEKIKFGFIFDFKWHYMVLYNDPSYLLKSFSMISPKHPSWMTSWPPGLRPRSQQPLGCKSGSEAKEVEFLRSLHSVCLTFLMGLSLHFPLNCHWKHLLEKFSLIQQAIELDLLFLALASGGHWGAVIVILHTWGCLMHSYQAVQVIL